MQLDDCLLTKRATQPCRVMKNSNSSHSIDFLELMLFITNMASNFTNCKYWRRNALPWVYIPPILFSFGLPPSSSPIMRTFSCIPLSPFCHLGKWHSSIASVNQKCHTSYTVSQSAEAMCGMVSTSQYQMARLLFPSLSKSDPIALTERHRGRVWKPVLRRKASFGLFAIASLLPIHTFISTVLTVSAHTEWPFVAFDGVRLWWHPTVWTVMN